MQKQIMTSILLLLFSIRLMAASTEIAQNPPVSPWGLSEEERQRYTIYLATGSFTGLLTYGLLAWDWGSVSDFKFGEEGWFGEDTYAGGADKLGHMYSLYLQKRGLHWILKNMGWDNNRANLYSTLIAESLGLAMEIGDGYSHYRFSWEDMLLNTAGIGLAALLDHSPKLDQLIGFRLMWFFSKNYLSKENREMQDPFSDYDGMTFLLSLKATGIPRIQENNYLRHLTLDLGYQSRGYSPSLRNDPPGGREKSRAIIFGVGINLSSLSEQFISKPDPKIAMRRLFKYWTPPYSVLPLVKKQQ